VIKMKAILKPEDLFKFKSPGDPQVSPDGTMVAYVVSQADKKADKNLTYIWVAPVNGGKRRRITSTGKDRAPRWSPDGKRLAFISERSGKPQIWIMEMEGGEAWHLVTDEAVRGVPVWSPDGKYIAFVARAFTKSDTWIPYPGAPEWDRRRALEQAERALAGKNKSGTGEKASEGNGGKRVSDVKVITRFRYRFDGIGYFGDLRNHIFMVRVPESSPDRGEVKGNTRRLTTGDYDHDSPAFSPDGRYIAFTAVRRDDADYLQKQDIWLLEVSTGRLIQLLDGDGPCFYPRWSPDGRKIAFSGHDNSYKGSTTPCLWVLDVESFLKEIDQRGNLSSPKPLTLKNAQNLTVGMDKPLGNRVSSDVRYAILLPPFSWKNENTLLFLSCDKGATGLYEVSVESGEIATLWHDPGKTVAAFSENSGTLVLQVGSPTQPEELYLFKKDAGTGCKTQNYGCHEAKEGFLPEKETACADEREDQKASDRVHCLTRLTNCNAWLEEVSLGEFERFSYTGADSWDIDGWLVYPSGYEKGKRYPLVLYIHGGPHGVYGSAFMFQAQIFASKGYAVLYTNPRGSQSYGQKFAYACVGDWGGKDYQDIMAGVDEVIARGIADPKRMFVTGWSYGGFMTSWVVTQTNRFKAAVAGAVVTDRYSMYSTSDITFFGEHHFGGMPWDEPERVLERSPIAHVRKVQTPVMLLHGEGDLRCPVSQSEEFYLALKRLGKTAVFIRYPGEFHGFTKPSHRFDRYARMVAWFDHYLNVT